MKPRATNDSAPFNSHHAGVVFINDLAETEDDVLVLTAKRVEEIQVINKSKLSHFIMPFIMNKYHRSQHRLQTLVL